MQLSLLLIGSGLVALLAAAVLHIRLLRILPKGQIRQAWVVMVGLVGLFVAGYGGAIALLFTPGQPAPGPLFPTILFFGALFVLANAKLGLATALDVGQVARLEAENVTDPLTGAFNRRYLYRRLEEEMARSRRYVVPLVVMVLDLDHFKNVNDVFGHKGGDIALQHASRTISESIRQTDFAARFGGEEFVVVAPQTSLEAAMTLAERLRAVLEESPCQLSNNLAKGREVALTTSVGVTALTDDMETVDDLIHAADSCLYRAKRLGRNRVAGPLTRRDVEPERNAAIRLATSAAS